MTLLHSLQALNIPTKINKGTVEIVSDVKLITQGEKVGASEATLLAKLGIKPFSYGLIVQQVPLQYLLLRFFAVSQGKIKIQCVKL